MSKIVDPKIPLPPKGMDLQSSMDAIERMFIKQALAATSSKKEAAELLGVSRQALHVKIKKVERHSRK